MNWSELIKKYFVELMDVVKGIKDFASEQVPLYLKELITYEFYHSIVWGSLYLLFCFICIWALRKFYRRLKVDEKKNSDNPVWFFICSGTLIAVIAFGINAVQEFDHAIKAKVAPRVIIVEKIQSLISSQQDNKSCNK